MFRGGHVRVRLEPVAKPDGGARWIATLDPREARAYDRAVGAVVPHVEASLSGSVLAERVRGRGAIGWTRLEPWRPARRRFRHAAAALGADPHGLLLLTDVRECYVSMATEVVERSLRTAGCDRTDVRNIVRMLDRFDAAGIRGLPVGPPPSAVLANAVLAGLDRAIHGRGLRHVRWVDDLVIAVPDGAVSEAMDVIATALDALRLRPNEAKTRAIPSGGTIRLRSSRSSAPPLP